MLAVQFTSSARIAACMNGISFSTMSSPSPAPARATALRRSPAKAGIDVAALAAQGPPRWTKESFRRTDGTARKGHGGPRGAMANCPAELKNHRTSHRLSADLRSGRNNDNWVRWLGGPRQLAGGGSVVLLPLQGVLAWTVSILGDERCAHEYPREGRSAGVQESALARYRTRRPLPPSS